MLVYLSCVLPSNIYTLSLSTYLCTQRIYLNALTEQSITYGFAIAPLILIYSDNVAGSIADS